MSIRRSIPIIVAMLMCVAWQSAARAAGTHVYFIRGIFDVSVGLDAMARRVGLPSSVYSHTSGGAVAAQAAADYKSGRAGTIILVGHSLGAGTAVEVARQLGGASIPVALVVLLDPVGASAVPSNVARVVNLNVSGATVGAESGFRGRLSNLDVRNDPSRPDHMTIQSDPSMQAKIIGYIRSAAGSGGGPVRAERRVMRRVRHAA
jgi:pimeloyl-ACP methyl ester carboxylesterase